MLPVRPARLLPIMLTALLCGASVAVSAVDAVEARDPAAGPEPSAAMSEKALTKAREQADRVRARRMSKAGKEERGRSRTAFRGFDRDEALALARDKFPHLLRSRKFDGASPAAGVRIDKQLGDGAAVAVDEDTGRKSLLLSSLPLQAKQPQGTVKPVDLALRESANGLELANPLVDLRIASRGAADVRFPGQGFGVEMIGEQRRAQESADRAFFASLRQDTDGVVTPTPVGAAISLQLRSDLAPERFEFDLDLPAGAIVRNARTEKEIPGDAPRSFEIVRDGQVLGYVRPALAYDSDGMPINADLTAEGQKLVLTVEHRGKDVAYPAIVDPEIVVPGNYYQGFPGWEWAQFPNGGAPVFGAARQDCAYSCGLYTSMPTNSTFKDGAYAHWYYRAPGNTHLYRVVFGGLKHDATWYYRPDWSCCETYSSTFQGIMNRAYNAYEQPVSHAGSYGDGSSGCCGGNPFWGSHEFHSVTHDFCFNGRCNRGGGEEMNYGLYGIQAYNRYNDLDVGTGGDRAFAIADWTSVYLGDRQRPWLEATPASRDWFDDGNAEQRLSVRARDNGLGIYGVTLGGANGGNGTLNAGCSGDPHRSACPTTWTPSFPYRLSEGVNNLTLRTYDIVDNYSDPHPWSLKVDRSAPDIVLSGDLAGIAGRTLWRDEHDLKIVASDGVKGGTASQQRSGVQRIAVALAPITGNGTVGSYEQKDAVEQPTGGDNQGLERTFRLRSHDLPEGRYRLRVTATDRLGHASTRELTFTAGHLGGDLSHFTLVPFARPSGAEDARVNVANGNALVAAQDAVVDAGAEKFDLVRSYNSARSSTPGALGLGWSLNLGPDVRLQQLGDGSVRFHGPSGYTARFTKAGAVWVAPPELNATLSEQDGRFRLYLADEERTLTFASATAPVSSIQDEGESTLRLTYRPDGTLERAVDDENRTTAFEATGGRITAVRLADGTEHRYVYDGDRLREHTVGTDTTRYEYDTGGQLNRVLRNGAERVGLTYSGGRAISLRLAEEGASTTTTLSYDHAASRTTVGFSDASSGTFTSDLSLLVTSSSVGARAPTLALAGTLPDRGGTTLASSTRYGMTIRATGNADSVDDVTVTVDDGEEFVDEQGCSTTGCSTSGEYTYDTDEHVGGQDVITVLAEAPNGDISTRSFPVGVPTLTGEAEPVPDRSEEEDIGDSKRFRSSYGFNSDDAYVRSVEADSANRERSPEYGVALTASEYTEMRTRADVQMAVHILRDYAEQFPTFAGLYIDQAGGGIVRVGFTGTDAVTRRDEIKQRFPYPDRVETFAAVRTEDELQALTARVSAEFDELQAQGIEVVNTGSRIAQNNVEVGVAGLTALERTQLLTRYGPGVNPVEANLPEDDARGTRFEFNRRLFAGILVRHTLGDGGRCTGAFSARRERRTRRGRRVFRFFTTTAGHCAAGQRPTWIHGNRPVGRTVDSTHFNKDEVDSDSQTISIPRRRISKLLVLDDYAARRLVAVERRFRDEEVGNTVCISGIYNNNCGVLDSRDESVEVNDKKFVNMRTATYDAQKGDSGAPLYFPYGSRREARVLGLHKGRFGTRAADVLRVRPYYGHAERIELRFNIKFCVRGRCS